MVRRSFLQCFLTVALAVSLALPGILPGLGSLRLAFADPGLPLSAESEFHQLLDQEGERFFQDFQRRLPELEQKPFRAAVQSAIARVKLSFNIKKFLSQNGRAAAIGTLVGVIISDFVGPAVLTAMGYPALGGLLAVSPTTPFMSVGAVYVAKYRQERQLSRELGVESLSELRAFRDEVLGFEAKERLFSTLIEDARSAVDGVSTVEVVRKIDKRAIAQSTLILEIADLQKIVASHPEGETYLKQAAVHAADHAVYAVRLLRFIQEKGEADPQLLSELLSAARARLSSELSSSELKRNLLKFNDAVLAAQALSERLRSRSAHLKTDLRWLSVSDLKQRREIGRALRARTDGVEAFVHAVQREEYLYLLSLLSPESARMEYNVAEVTDSFSPSLSVLSRQVREFESVAPSGLEKFLHREREFVACTDFFGAIFSSAK